MHFKSVANSKMSRTPLVISAITALYFLNVVQAVTQWVWTDGFLVLNGKSSHAAYLYYAHSGTDWLYLVTNINAVLLGTIADSLLVRVYTLRCSSC